jgi:hypothetical protein
VSHETYQQMRERYDECMSTAEPGDGQWVQLKDVIALIDGTQTVESLHESLIDLYG